MTQAEQKQIEQDAIKAAGQLCSNTNFDAILAYIGMQYERRKESLVNATPETVQQTQGQAQALKQILGLVGRAQSTQGGRTQPIG